MFTTSLSNGFHGLGNYIENASVGTGNEYLGAAGGFVGNLVGGVGSFIGGTMTMLLDPYTVVQGIGDAVKNGYNLYNTYGAWAVAAHYTGMQSFAEAITGKDMVTGAPVDALQKTSQGFLPAWQLGHVGRRRTGVGRKRKWRGNGSRSGRSCGAEEAAVASAPGATGSRVLRSIDEFRAGRNFASEMEAQKAWEVYQRAADAEKGILIGHGSASIEQAYDGWQSLRMLNESPYTRAVGSTVWTEEINMAWIDGAVHAGKTVRLVTPFDQVFRGIGTTSASHRGWRSFDRKLMEEHDGIHHSQRSCAYISF